MIGTILPDGRLHLQHGPIDLIIEAFGSSAEVQRACWQARDRFGDILPTLVRELPVLRRPVGDVCPLLQGPVARRMAEAVWPHRAVYITPMAAVAGSVADEMLAAMVSGRTLDKAYVNNGGDIAFHLSEGHELKAGIFVDALDGAVRLTHDQPARGMATSGWGGRSFSLGIADSVTVLAADAAMADAAATIIANAVDADHPAIERRPARELDPDSDLGDFLVTTHVGPLPADLVDEALNRGAAEARRLGLSAALCLQGRWRMEDSRHPERSDGSRAANMLCQVLRFAQHDGKGVSSMSDDEDALQSALACLDAYMDGLNRGDEPAVNAACHFPHVRLAGGKVGVWEKSGDYKLADFRSRAGDGWHRSSWDERTPIHVGDNKVHLEVKFSRWRQDGSLIGAFETIYIVTRLEGRWGIQARSSFAS